MNAFTTQVQTRDGRDVVIEISDSGETIWIKTLSGEEIGRAELSYIEDDVKDYYRLTWMYLDLLDPSYRRQGLGRAALQFHLDNFASSIEVSENDGHRKSDGSHLSGDAPAFVGKMVQEGLLTQLSSMPENETDFE